MKPAILHDGIEKRILCARFYERIKVFYEDPENLRRFEEWQASRKNPNDLRTTVDIYKPTRKED